MSSTTTPTNPIANLAAAELAIVIQPVNDFLTALQQPSVNTQTVIQDWAKLQLAVMSDIPALESVGIDQIAAFLQGKLNGWLASVATTNPTATPAA